MKVYLFIFILFITQAQARLFVQPVLGYHSDSDDVNTNDFVYATQIIDLFIGGTFGKGERWVVGTNLQQTTRTSSQGANEDELSIIEIGPRFQYYFSEMQTGYIAGTYNFYANGDRTLANNAQEVQGTSTIFTMGYHMKISKHFYLGISINYHTISISKQTVSGTTTDVSQSYNLLYPALETSFRF